MAAYGWLILWMGFGLVGRTGVAGAVEPAIWRDDTQSAFLKGKAKGVSLTDDGVVELAPALKEVADTGEQFVWALAEGPKGRLYLATGNGGKVFSMVDGGKPELLFDSPEVAIFSLAVGPDGTVYAGSSPGGLIYRLAPGREPATLCRTGDEHVWSLIAGADGTLYAATGGKHGRILKISAQGSIDEICRSSDPNMVSMIRGSDGTLYAGTDENGLIYRVDPAGKVSVLYQAQGKEIHALALGPDGTLYAAAIASGSQTSGDKSNSAQSNSSAQTQEISVLYAIRPSGAAFELWDVPEPMLLALSVGTNGQVTALTGDKGSVYRVRPDGETTLLARITDVQPWAFCSDRNGGLWIGTAGAGKVFRLGRALSTEGTLTSEARDFTLASHWGRLSWKAETPEGTSVVFQTRSGNSEVPDDTWSAWSEPLAVSGSQISSPPARFLQYRARLTSKDGQHTPRLREVRLAGLQVNVRPQILSVDVTPPQRRGDADGGSARAADGEGSGGRHVARGERRGVWKVSWVAGDVNNDRLVYNLYYRGQGEKEWKLLRKNLRSTSYFWNVESAPEGTVQVKVTASDRLSNPASLALSAEKVSAPFEIDHTPPAVRLAPARQVGPGKIEVTGSVADETSPVRSASYAVNAGPWQVIFPTDGIFDSRTESLDFTVGGLSPGEYTVVVRASDTLGNVGVGKTVIDIK